VLLVLSQELAFVSVTMARKVSIIHPKRKRGNANGRRKAVQSAVVRNERDL